MTSRRLGTQFSVLIFTLALAVATPARAHFSYDSPGSSSVSLFGLGYGAGIS
jgi:hypothetical protein